MIQQHRKFTGGVVDALLDGNNQPEPSMLCLQCEGTAGLGVRPPLLWKLQHAHDTIAYKSFVMLYGKPPLLFFMTNLQDRRLLELGVENDCISLRTDKRNNLLVESTNAIAIMGLHPRNDQVNSLGATAHSTDSKRR